MSALAILPKTLIVAKDTAHLHFIGFGGAGVNALLLFNSKGISGKYTAITTTDRDPLPPDIHFIAYNLPHTHGDKTMFEYPEAVHQLLDTDEYFVLLAGLGGFCGTFMLEATMAKLNEQNKNYTAITTAPFAFEKDRQQRAQAIIEGNKRNPIFIA